MASASTGAAFRPKALLPGAELYTEAITHGSEWGLDIDPKAVKVDWDKVIGRSRKITGTLNNGSGSS